MATSYICEHSAEFYLVPYLKSLLEREFEYVAPISPWLSREFAGKSKKLHQNASFRVLVVFPRRPKISNGSDIFMTVNAELEAFKKVGIEYGISVIAGCPLATDFWELATANRYAWLNIGRLDTYEYLINASSPAEDRGGLFLTDEQILELVKKSSIQTMDSFESFVRDARYSQPPSFFWGRYKPVYFLTKAH